MKKFTHKQVDVLRDRKFASGELTLEEVRKFDDPVRTTLSEYRVNMYESARVLCKLTACQCLESLRQSIDRVIGLDYYFEGSENRLNPLTSQEIAEHKTKRSNQYRRLAYQCNREADQKKQCHYAFRHFLVCYCDEHKHP